MLQRVSPLLTTYQPGSSTAVPAVSQLRDRVATRVRLGSARALRPAVGVLLPSALFGPPASPLEPCGDGTCATWPRGSKSLAAIFAASVSADWRSAASLA